MDTGRKKILIMAALLAGLGVALLFAFGPLGGGDEVRSTATATGGGVAGGGRSVVDSDPEYLETVAEIARSREERSYDAEPERDPMVALVLESDARASRIEREEKQTPVTLPAMTLGGIIWDAENPIAMINGTDVRPGDTIRGARVVSIGQDSVELTYKGKRFVLSLE